VVGAIESGVDVGGLPAVVGAGGVLWSVAVWLVPQAMSTSVIAAIAPFRASRTGERLGGVIVMEPRYQREKDRDNARRSFRAVRRSGDIRIRSRES